jgi:hypothetical protein
MSQRLELERQRRRVAEEALTSWQQKQAPGGDYDMDLEEGTPTSVLFPSGDLARLLSVTV